MDYTSGAMNSGPIDDAVERWPGVKWETDDFGRALKKRGIEAETCEHLAELYVAGAAIRGDEAAIRVIDGLLRKIAPTALTAARTPDYSESELAQDVLDFILVHRKDMDGGARLEQYTGRGPLEAWLRTCAVNTCLMHKRRQAGRRGSDVGTSQTPDPTDDPELAVLKRRHRELFKEALVGAFAQLDTRARTILRFHYLDGLEQQEIAVIYGVHPASISRWLTTAREEVLERTRQHISGAVDDMSEIWPLVQSRIYVSLRGLLKSRA